MLTRCRQIAGLGACLLLMGCGFQPLYGSREDGSSVAHALSSVSIPEPTTRLAQLIRNELLSSMAPGGTGTGDLYTLELLAQAKEDTAIQSLNTDVLRRIVRINADFRLVEDASGKAVYAGKSFSHASYDRTGTPFANYQARITAEERAAKEIGSDIRTRLAAYFASH